MDAVEERERFREEAVGTSSGLSGFSLGVENERADDAGCDGRTHLKRPNSQGKEKNVFPV